MGRSQSPPMTPGQRMMRRTLQPTPPSAARAGSVRLLITVNVLGSAGPIRFVVKEEELVGSVISTALRSYAREGRRPVLGSDFNNFLLYCTNSCSDALSPLEPIGSLGSRNFTLCKKQGVAEEGNSQHVIKKSGGRWKGLLNGMLSFRITAH
ncbi:hypothetical protein J5N97_007572 [Dioscorea zingiberensis]|uniref:DUF7054 domain-containing protein n=1 Tax=Dioscorea zingiberensis TaxID=325984 RepID=A0A9D5DC90_9LILI|nr:hypothetical protein J5N97_007572 [Dioscorea zingiberensis]